MKFTIHKDPLPFLYIENIFEKEELSLIYRELEFLQPKLQNPEQTGTAVINGNILKKNSGAFLDDIFSKKEFSDILTINRKLLSKEVVDLAEQCSPGYGIMSTASRIGTLISYYENNDYYERHLDISAITIVTWFFKQPKNFTGGDFSFTDYNITIEPKNNTGVLFFSNYMHQVDSTQLLSDYEPCSGRFSMSLFCRHQ